ncbi:sugar diacid recognition domain-containing protein [Halobacillus sp. Marseille-Q1614]|uniref:CdaR family transcriptional regulator n=1 Tax=Halobacillus sp. Marseille-Q1614 TaxID=2709134 RepID=UPI00156EB7C3|nr:sugar diacid recognition domain-containing protein [Halobacillus sp. Marseille-Q1614]
MKLLPELANKIIQEVQIILKEHVIVLDENAFIIASTEPDRVGSFHEVAHRVLQTKEKQYITEEETQYFLSVKAGINLPIFFESEVIGVIGITGDPESVEPYADLLRKMTELMVREKYHIEQKAAESRGLESYFYEWIYADEMDEDFIQRGELLGISVGTPYLCVLFYVKTNKTRIQANMEDAYRQLVTKSPEDVFIPWGEGQFLLLKRVDGEKDRQILKTEMKQWQEAFHRKYDLTLAIGVSNFAARKYLKPTYIEAEKALKVSKTRRQMVQYEELMLDIILEEVSESAKEEFLGRVLRDVQDRTELLETLTSYFSQNQSLVKTAQELNIHVNTLHYRLNQLKNTTGIDPRDAEGITLFYLALCFMGIYSHRT